MSGRLGACMVGGMHGGGCVAGGVCVHGGGGACMAGGMHGGGHVWGGIMHGRRDGHCSGRYASHWNAFLFRYLIILW